MSIPAFLAFLSAASGVAVTAVCLARCRRSLSDLALAAVVIVITVERACGGLSLKAETFGGVEYWQTWRFATLALFPAVWLAFSLVFARGNPGSFVQRWWHALGCALVIPPVVVGVFVDRLFSIEVDGAGWILRLGWPAMFFQVLGLVATVLAVTNLERTFSASVGTIRWRVKFVLLAVGAMLVVWIYMGSQSLLYRSVSPKSDPVWSLAVILGNVILALYIRRMDPQQSNVYPSFSMLEGSITILLAGVYLIVVGLFAATVVAFGGHTAFPLKALLLLVSLIALAAMLQSDRVRLAVRRTISRHFQRPLHDYRTVWRRYSETTASCVEQLELCRATVKETAEVLQALSVTLWWADENKRVLTLAASTSLPTGTSALVRHADADAAAVIARFESSLDPVDIDAAREPWAATLRAWNPVAFPHGGHRVCAPLVRQRNVVGLLVVGDRVDGVPFTLQDIEMLKCITGHIASSLLNLQLSQRLLQMKELEAFQTMAAFFVHDLKNSASTLTLALQNLPQHFNKPDFREDVLRCIGNAVTHINGLIGRLSLLRHGLELHRGDCDLNEIVAAALREFETPAAPALVRTLQPLPKAALDREQIRKVVTNLVLNATEATAGRGEVRVSTGRNNGYVVLTVSDNGCGMSADFMQRSLFRPFQTTKKSGLGIGMFQSKMIVEAHGGHISVASEPRQGTTFSVYLPAHGNQSQA